MHDTDLAWTAGIVDGEGCISLHTVTTSKGNQCYVLRLDVTNTNLLMLNRLQELFGGNIIAGQRVAEHHKDVWHWQVASKNAERVLSQIESYLVNKREECKVGLLSRTLMQKQGSNKVNPHTQKLMWLKNQLSTLKTAP